MFRGRTVSLFLYAIISFCLLGAAVLAQSNFGSIRGQVRDASGAAVAGATVKITDVGTNAEVTLATGNDGQYAAPSLRPVTYNIRVEARGFKTTTVNNVKVDTAKDSGVDIVLEPGNVSDTVMITGDAPLLQTETGAVTQTITGRTIVDTPLNGRNVLELALTLPGTAGSVGTEFTSTSVTVPIPGREISINGGRAGTTQFLADGMNVTSVGLARTAVSFSPDTIQEFSVLQSNYSAQYSQAGGGIIQQTTKSGANEFHGVGYWFHRQKFLTANPFQSPRLAVLNNDNRAPLRRQQIGATIGGPIWLPKKFFGPASYDGRNRSFFFFSYEPTRQLAGNNGASFERVPTDLEIKGDFSQSKLYDAQGNSYQYPLLYNHFLRQSGGTLLYLPYPGFNPAQPASAANPLYQFVFANNLFNPNDPDPNRRGRVLVDAAGVSYVNPAAAAIARALYPQPNIDLITSGSAAGANYVYFRQARNKDDRYTTRIDQKIGDNHNLSGRYTYQPLYGDRAFRDPVGTPGTSETSRSRQILLSLTSTLRPTLVNEFRAGYVYGNFATNFPSDLLTRDGTTPFLDLGGAGRGTPNFLGFGIADFFSGGAPANNGVAFGRLGLNGIQNIGRNTEHNYSITDDVTWTHGAQSIKFGFLATHQQSNTAGAGYGYQAGGRWNFNARETADALGCGAPPGLTGSLPSTCRNATARTGDAFASFLLGVPDSLFAYENIAQPYYYRWKSFGGYMQDDWKFRPNLTLNIGLRYQYQSPRWEKFNRQGELNLTRLEANPFSKDANGNPLPAPVFEFAGFDGRSRYLTPPRYTDFEPRFSFAWSPGFGWNKDSRFVLRGGYGITHSTLTGRNRLPFPNLGSKADAFRQYNVGLGTTDFTNPSNIGGCGLAICDPSVPGQFGYNNVVYIPDPTLFVIPASGVIRPGDTARVVNGVAQQDKRYGQTGWVFDKNFRTPTIQNFSFELQYELMRNTVVTVGYQGSHGTHLFSTPRDINVNPFTGAKAYPGFNGASGGRLILMDETGSGSIYHAAKFIVERRFAGGLQFNFNYTFSKSIDDASGGIEFDFANLSGQDSGGQQIKINPPQNSFGATSERAVSSYDTPHVLNLTMLYEMPFGKGRAWLNRDGLLNHVIGGWQFNALGRLSSGQPLFVDLGNSNSVGLASNTGLGNPRPNIIAGVPLRNPDWTEANAATTPFLNPRAFSIPEPGTFGNAPRNLNLHMPFQRRFDASLFKDIRPFKSETRRIQFRLEVFNLFNAKSYGFSGLGTTLFNGLAQNLQGQPNRYANLTTDIWNRVVAGPGNDTGLAGPRTAAGAYDASKEPAGTALSPLGVYSDLVNRYNRGSFTNFNFNVQNSISPRVIQLGVKFYF
jgi:hypothetical protein